MSIYREYDIRGIYEKELNEETITRLGYALADEMKQYGEYVGVGYDARSHSPILFEYLTAGLNAGGMKVLGMGMVPTPVNYFCNYQEFDGITVLTTQANTTDLKLRLIKLLFSVNRFMPSVVKSML